ncbi:RnfH family protein [Burkholderiales bacterium]|nr:RnfH family protein [Burkholderiales bacterium]
MSDKPLIDVEVLFVTDMEEHSEFLSVDSGSTIVQVLGKSRVASIAQSCLGIQPLSIGVWGKRMKVTAIVGDGDRIEIYRDLIADPKELRRSGRLISKRVQRSPT